VGSRLVKQCVEDCNDKFSDALDECDELEVGPDYEECVILAEEDLFLCVFDTPESEDNCGIPFPEPFCGNMICEEGESPFTCEADCGPPPEICETPDVCAPPPPPPEGTLFACECIGGFQSMCVPSSSCQGGVSVLFCDDLCLLTTGSSIGGFFGCFENSCTVR